MTEYETIKRLAGEMAEAFHWKNRQPGREEYCTLKEGSPDWMTDAIREAHDHANVLPDDHRYGMILDAVNILSECDDEDEAIDRMHEHEAPVYTGNLLAWLSSHISRAGYCDDAMKEYGGDVKGITDLIALGWHAEWREVFYQIKAALEAHAEAIEA